MHQLSEVYIMKKNTSKTKETIKKILQKIRLRYLGIKDINRFSKSAAFSLYDDSYEQLTSRIMYNVHAIEKGLSRSHNFRAGFGKKALSTLNDAMVIYTEKGHSKESFPYTQGRSIFLKYIQLHKDMNADTSFLNKFVDQYFLIENQDFQDTGVKEIYLKDKLENINKNFYELAQNRSSVRDFSGEPVDREQILRAIQNATKTPSVCNRQGWSVYLVEDKQKIEKLLEFQRGFRGYPKLPENVLTIAVSNSTFLSPVERNEAFVDGGLFAMSVIYGIEYEGLAAVTLNAMMNSKDEKGIRELLKVDESEQIILFIAIGQFKERAVVPVSDRKKAESFTKII